MKDLTQGSLIGHVLTMAAPISLGIVLIMLCQLVDLYFVGGLGDAASPASPRPAMPAS